VKHQKAGKRTAESEKQKATNAVEEFDLDMHNGGNQWITVSPKLAKVPPLHQTVGLTFSTH
jgi:hypothetical protein